MQVATLYFGRGLPGGGEVTDQDWLEFLDKVITPNLPDGYTVFDAFGDWRAPGSTRTAQERSKVLLVALRPGPEGRAALERVRQTYQAQFHQLLVGMTLMPGCGDF